MHTAPTAITTTATKGSQTFSRTALPTERWLTRSPPVPDFVFSLRARLLGKADPTTAISTRLIYGRARRYQHWAGVRTRGVRTVPLDWWHAPGPIAGRHAGRRS